jgi:hypothetical protein
MATSEAMRREAEMLMRLSGRHTTAQIFDGTLTSTIRLYQTDPQSPYRTLKPSSRHPYDTYAAKLTAHIGKRRIDGRPLGLDSSLDDAPMFRWGQKNAVLSVNSSDGGATPQRR